jgi:hypothetical protein
VVLKILALANQRVVRAKIEYLALTKNYHDGLAKVRPPATRHNYVAIATVARCLLVQQSNTAAALAIATVTRC